MKSQHTKTRASAALLLLSAAGTLCAGNGRLYPGDPRPVNETALLVSDGEFWIDSIKQAGGEEKRMKPVSAMRMKISVINNSTFVVEVLPGHYDVCMAFRDEGGLYAHATRKCGVAVDAQAGHVSYIELVPAGHDSPWVPAVRDVPAHDADDENAVTLRTNSQIRKAVDKYLQGGRPALAEDSKGYWK